MAEREAKDDVGFRPLYAQVRTNLTRRLADGTWPPGMTLPSEFELAAELGVSQGTVRKALDAMTAENLLVRRQGKGTFVAEPEESRILFQFFHLKLDDGGSPFPLSSVLGHTCSPAIPEETRTLQLKAGETVWHIERVRSLDGKPAIAETITLSSTRFEGFDRLETIPNNVYRLYSTRWGITIAQSEERLKAVAATPEDARLLDCAVGEPLLLVNRVAYDLEGQPIEMRASRCLTRETHYGVRLR